MDLLSSLPDVDSFKPTKYTNADTQTYRQLKLETGVCMTVGVLACARDKITKMSVDV